MELYPPECEVKPFLYQELKNIWHNYPYGNSSLTFKDISYEEIHTLASPRLKSFLNKIKKNTYQRSTQYSRWKLNRPYQGMIILQRFQTPAIDKNCLTNVPHQIIRHSKDGLDWGVHCPGQRYDLALNSLNPFFSRSYKQINLATELLYQEFADDFLKNTNQNCCVISQKEIITWLKERNYPAVYRW